MIEAEVDILIPFHDIDVMSIVWHGHYVKYFEIARCALLDKINYNYRQMAESNYAWPVIDIRVKYIKPATFGNIIKVHAKLVEYENRLKINYLITDSASGQTLSKGYTIQVAVDMRNEEMCFVSPDILFEKVGVKQ
jgi:acyl-CoA thioester hydrolase